jgi:hypothetical protein
MQALLIGAGSFAVDAERRICQPSKSGRLGITDGGGVTMKSVGPFSRVYRR